MTRVRRPDTLHTELAEIRRRLRLLEASSTRRGPGQPVQTTLAGPSPGGGAAGGGGVPSVVPTRPGDWWACRSGLWERMALVWCPPGVRDLRLVIWAVGEGAEGAVRVTLAGSPVGGEVAVGREPTRHLVEIRLPGGGDTTDTGDTGDTAGTAGTAGAIVEARRTGGRGVVRLIATIG